MAESDLVISIPDDCRVFWRNAKLNKLWGNWKIWGKCSEEEKQQANSREIRKDEIVLDDDDNQGAALLKKLDDKNYKYLTISSFRGKHIHLFFDNLSNLDEEVRQEIRTTFISKYNCDLAKASEKTLISIENKPHHKDNDFICKINSDKIVYNHIDEEAIEKAKKVIKERKEKAINISPDLDFEDYFEEDEFFNFIKHNIIGKEKERNNVVFCNLAIACAHSGKNENEIKEIISPIIKNNFPGKNYAEFNGWLQKAFSGEIKDYNKKQLDSWGEKYFGKNFYRLVEIERPHEGRLISEFAADLAPILKNKNILFYRIDAKEIVEIQKVKLHKTSENFYIGFMPILPARFITLIEKYVQPVIFKWDNYNKDWKPKRKSIDKALANTLVNSNILQQSLPQIKRIFSIPLPILYDNKITFPKKGYDERFESWLIHDSPNISNPNMTLEEAKQIIDFLFKEFCFDEDIKHNKTNAIAGLLTPFLRGLFPSFNVRTPVFFYLGNREGTGKDYLAGITGIVYEGQVIEEPPISNSEKLNNNSEELRKKILGAFLSGRKRLHFSNNKGFVDNAVLESLATNPRFSDRLLGRNEIFTFDNELDLSLSGNIGVSYTPDFARRCRFIKLFLEIENINERKFEQPYLHEWAKKNRTLILSALYSLVKNWIELGCPKGKIIFTSYPEWAEICGGIMEAAEYGSPCEPDVIDIIGGDVETSNMKKLFELCYETYPEKIITKREVRNLVLNSGEEMFENYELEKQSGKIKFGNLLLKYTGRILSGIKMQVDNKTKKTINQKLKFTNQTQTKIGVTC